MFCEDILASVGELCARKKVFMESCFGNFENPVNFNHLVQHLTTNIALETKKCNQLYLHLFSIKDLSIKISYKITRI